MGCFSEKDREVQKKAFFKENIIAKQDENETFDFKNMKTKVMLEFSIENIEINHKYQIEAKFLESFDGFATETVLSKRNIITFNTRYISDYYFEKRQNLQISLIKDFQKRGTVQLPLGQIVGSPGSSLKKLIDKNKLK